MVKSTLLTLCLSAVFLPQLLASKMPKVSKELVKLAYREFSEQKRVLFYIGRHIHTPHLVIWGQTTLSEDMVAIFLKNQNDVEGMESLLRSYGNRWASNYNNYLLSSFAISASQQSDSMIRKAVKESDGLQLLKGYVEEVDTDMFGDILKLYDKNGVEIVPVEKGERKYGAECALYPEGDACALLFHTLNEMSRAENKLPPQQEMIQQYFEAKGEEFFRNGGYIILTDMAKGLGMRGSAVGNYLRLLKENLPEDHFIRQIIGEPIGKKRKRIYHLDGVESLILSPEQEKVQQYFENKGEQFFRDGGYITISKVAKDLDMGRVAVGQYLSSLKEKLPDGHFIYQIVRKKKERIYHFKGIEPQIKIISPITPKQEKVLQYFEDKEQFFRNGGHITAAEIADKLGMSGNAVGKKNLIFLKKKLPDHPFIQKIVSRPEWIERKAKTIYHLDGIEPQIISSKQEKVRQYFEDKGEEFFRNGGYITISKVAKDLDMDSNAVGQNLRHLKEKLPDGHFIRQIERKKIEGKRAYHLP